MGALGAILVIVGFFGGFLSGDEESPFYIIGMIGFLPIFGSAMALMASTTDDKK